jgi:hypothetical protein
MKNTKEKTTLKTKAHVKYHTASTRNSLGRSIDF